MRFAIVKNGVVVNVAIADTAITPDWVPTDVAGIGWLYADGVFTNPDLQQEPNASGGGGGPLEPV